MRVYVLTVGEYSDRSVWGVVSDAAMAKDLEERLGVESSELELDDPAQSLSSSPPGSPYYIQACSPLIRAPWGLGSKVNCWHAYRLSEVVNSTEWVEEKGIWSKTSWHTSRENAELEARMKAEELARKDAW